MQIRAQKTDVTNRESHVTGKTLILYCSAHKFKTLHDGVSVTKLFRYLETGEHFYGHIFEIATRYLLH